MIKLGTSSSGVLVKLSNNEFKQLSGKLPGNVEDGTNISLAKLKQLADLVTANQNKLIDIREEAAQLVSAINALV